MTSKPSIALYLGETYATVGLFKLSEANDFNLIYEKTVFLPQVSLKNLLNQCKVRLQENFKDFDEPLPVYIVTKYFDRLKQFRLGGSISQVVLKGFENSYTLNNSKCLSLAATQLIISLEADSFDEDYLKSELERIKKINPDLNKVVISLPEDKFSTATIEKITNYFSTAGLKIFRCNQAYNQSELRKTLLNAGSEGTKDEIIGDLTEVFGESVETDFFCLNGFAKKFDNCELFNSANNFFAQYLKSKKLNCGAYFDIESFRFIRTGTNTHWSSPWGQIPVTYCDYSDLSIHPYAEVRLNALSMLNIDTHSGQLEPGPILAGRAIKPLVLDLFLTELQENEFCKNIFSQISQETLKTKINNLFSVLEKGQKLDSLATTVSDLKKIILEALTNEVKLLSPQKQIHFMGPLCGLFPKSSDITLVENFSWPLEIMKSAVGQK